MPRWGSGLYWIGMDAKHHNPKLHVLNQSKKKDKHKFIQNLFQNLKITKNVLANLFLSIWHCKIRLLCQSLVTGEHN
jgi:hypothetical protein